MNRKILVADDSDNIRNVLQLNFEWKGYEVLAAADGEEALQMVQRVRPDLIILDVMMPRKNGFQVCRQVKSDARTADIPVILLTAKNQQEDRFWGRDCGADEYMTKPFNTPTLEKVVKRLLDRAAGGGEEGHGEDEGQLRSVLEKMIGEGHSCAVTTFRLSTKALMVHRQKYGEIRHRQIFDAVTQGFDEILREAQQEIVYEEEGDLFRVLFVAAAARVREIQHRMVERSNELILESYDDDDRAREFVTSRDFLSGEELQIPLVSLNVEETLLYNQD